MLPPSRRTALKGLLSAAALAAGPARAQHPAPAPAPFRYEDVVRRARELAAVPFDASRPPLPEPLPSLGFDQYRDIRFRPDRALLGGGPFRLHLFHLGFLFQRPVTVNVVRDGVPNPIPYQPQLFDFGAHKVPSLPVNVGFAGFRLHHPLNNPRVFDEVIAFLGASYFRFLGRDQRYGISARGLAVNVVGPDPEEFPFFREFWIENPPPAADRALVYALLDGAAATGAYRFEIRPGPETAVEVGVTLFPRRTVAAMGVAPLTSMFFMGENDRKPVDDFRPELHDSDGLLMHAGHGEWIWRPLRNPAQKSMSSFLDTNPRGFGLLQRDRHFESYQDLEARYHERPGYWVTPRGHWGEGRVQLVEIPTRDETEDNVVAFWEPRHPFQPGQEIAFGYEIRAIGATEQLHPGGRAVNTFQKPPEASGSYAAPPDGRRFLVDFAGGDLGFQLGAPEQVEVVATTSVGEIVRTFVVPNEPIQGLRAAFDVRVPSGQTTDLRAFLRVGERALTETWTFPWTAP